MQTRVYRNHDNDLIAETVIPLGADRRELRIETRKSYLCKCLETCAVVVQIYEDGHGYKHVLGLGSVFTGDFRKDLARSPGRATEKAIRAMHDTVLARADAILADAKAFYAKRHPT